MTGPLRCHCCPRQILSVCGIGFVQLQVARLPATENVSGVSKGQQLIQAHSSLVYQVADELPHQMELSQGSISSFQRACQLWLASFKELAQLGILCFECLEA